MWMVKKAPAYVVFRRIMIGHRRVGVATHAITRCAVAHSAVAKLEVNSCHGAAIQTGLFGLWLMARCAVGVDFPVDNEYRAHHVNIHGKGLNTTHTHAYVILHRRDKPLLKIVE